MEDNFSWKKKLRGIFYELRCEYIPEEHENILIEYTDLLKEKGVKETFCRMLIDIVSGDEDRETVCKMIAKKLEER